MAELLANDVLKIFLNDTELRKKYNLSDDIINNVTMTSKESDIIIILIRELIKQFDDVSSTKAAATLNNMLDNRL